MAIDTKSREVGATRENVAARLARLTDRALAHYRALRPDEAQGRDWRELVVVGYLAHSGGTAEQPVDPSRVEALYEDLISIAHESARPWLAFVLGFALADSDSGTPRPLASPKGM